MYDRTLKMGHGFRDEMSNFKKPKKPSFPFISVAERQRLKLCMLEEKNTNNCNAVPDWLG